MENEPVKTAVIGAGMISDIYLTNMIQKFPTIEVVAIGAASGAQEKAKQYGIRAEEVEDIFADPEIELIVNLTPVQFHYELIKQALEAGKHVYTEKTLTNSPGTAQELLLLAQQKGLLLGSAPDTFLGASLQTARKLIDEGEIGQVTSFVVSANRENDHMLSYYPFLRAPGCGVCYDYGVYYMTALASLFGSVATTAAFTDNPIPRHINSNVKSPDYGQEFICDNESRVSAILRFESGLTGTFHLNANSIVKDQAEFIVYGTKGILHLGNPDKFGSEITLIKTKNQATRETEKEIINFQFPFENNSRGIGPADMAEAIRRNTKPRVSAELAYHVLEVLDSLIQGRDKQTFVQITSRCERPKAMEP